MALLKHQKSRDPWLDTARSSIGIPWSDGNNFRDSFFSLHAKFVKPLHLPKGCEAILKVWPGAGRAWALGNWTGLAAGLNPFRVSPGSVALEGVSGRAIACKNSHPHQPVLFASQGRHSHPAACGALRQQRAPVIASS